MLFYMKTEIDLLKVKAEVIIYVAEQMNGRVQMFQYLGEKYKKSSQNKW